MASDQIETTDPPGVTDPVADAAERFAKDTAGHELTILREDGLYRHLRFRKPQGGYSGYWYDLITWPGVLVIRGDMETFAFSRTEDMIGFFRECGRVNPGYWGEKLIAPKSRDVRRYSEEGFRWWVTERAADAEKQWPGLTAALNERVFDAVLPRWDATCEDGAREILKSFEFGAKWSGTCACGETAEWPDDDQDLSAELNAMAWRRVHPAGHPLGQPEPVIGRSDGFRFGADWDLDLSDWTYQYLWCCHAIVFGIGLYDAAKAAEKAAREQADGN